MNISSDWPFKGKPITNTYIQILLFLMGLFVFVVVGMIAPAATLGVFSSGLAFYTIRCIYRDIRKEWK